MPASYIREERLDRPSAEPQTFSLTNPLGGTLDLYVQGQLNAASVYADGLSGGGAGLICASTESTLLYQCQTVLCNPGPPNLFFACNGRCSSATIRTCDNTLVGDMISPASQY